MLRFPHSASQVDFLLSSLEGVPVFISPFSTTGISDNIAVSHISPESRLFGLHFVQTIWIYLQPM